MLGQRSKKLMMATSLPLPMILASALSMGDPLGLNSTLVESTKLQKSASVDSSKGLVKQSEKTTAALYVVPMIDPSIVFSFSVWCVEVSDLPVVSIVQCVIVVVVVGFCVLQTTFLISSVTE